MRDQFIIYISVLVLAATLPEVMPGYTTDIEQLFDNFTREYLALNPELVSELGITKEMGYDIKKDALTDVSDETIDREYNMMRKYKALLDSIDRKELTYSQSLSADILSWYLDSKLNGEEFRYHPYVIDHMFGFHNQLTTLMTEYHTINTLKDAEDYIARLEKFGTKFDQLLGAQKIREDMGIIPPIFIIDRLASAMSEFVSVEPHENILYTSFRDKVRDLQGLDINTKENLYREALDKIKSVVYPSYSEFILNLNRLKEKATEDPGVWKLPRGDKYYEYCLHYHTTTNLSPEEIHQLGLKEVERIQDEIRNLLASLGIKQGETFGQLQNIYYQTLGDRDDGGLFYPQTEEGKEQALEDYQAIIDQVADKLPQLFSLIPDARVTVKRVPEYKEKTMGTFYLPASLDGSREGIFYANLSNLPLKPGMKTLTYHEAIPGHHFQFSVERESPDHRMFRNLFFFTGYAEGWALYAEKLAKEQGWYDDIYSTLGYLNSELFRAVRLVVDTGIHYKKWSREQTYNYMIDNLGWGSYGEIDRYIVWPGQACAYKVGELKILELRERAKKELGGKFNIKEFHRVILQHGSVPLEILEKLVKEWIEDS